MDPDQTAPSLIGVHTVCKNDFYNRKQITKQTTIVVICMSQGRKKHMA